RRRKGPSREMAAATDPRATDGTAGKSQTPAAASKTPSTESDMPTEATASAATTWTGFSAGDRGNCEEQGRAGDDASHQAGLGGHGRVRCRCAPQRPDRRVGFCKLRAPCADMSRTLKWRMVLAPSSTISVAA